MKHQKELLVPSAKILKYEGCTHHTDTDTDIKANLIHIMTPEHSNDKTTQLWRVLRSCIL